MRRKANTNEITVGSKVEFTYIGQRFVGVVVEDHGPIGWKGRRLLRVRVELTPPTRPEEIEIPAERVKLAA